jgi:hypothetical protein
MRRLPALVLLILFAAPVLAAEKLAPLDAEFLDYLASFGGDEEDWELFADEQPAVAKPSPPAKEPAAKPTESKTEAAVQSAEKR